MAPEPTKNLDNNTNISSSNVIEDDISASFVIVYEDDVEGQSSDENDISDSEYAGYKLLQQDEMFNGLDNDIDVVEDSGSKPDSKPCETNTIDGDEIIQPKHIDQINIDYQHLTCIGLNDELPSTGLGFPDILPECESVEKEVDRDDNIEMNKDKEELVKNVMAGFLLPQTNIPDWAKNISEDKWKKSIAMSVNQKNGT